MPLVMLPAKPALAVMAGRGNYVSPRSVGNNSGSSSPVSCARRRPPRTNSVPLMLWVPPSKFPKSPSDRPASAFADWPCLRERTNLLSVTAERDILKQENRSLNLEVARLRRHARMELAMQRAEMLAQQAERDELEQLAAEARRLLDLKEKLDRADGDAADPGSDTEGQMSDDERQEVEEKFAEEHCQVLKRAQLLCGGSAPPERTMPGSDWDMEDFTPRQESMFSNSLEHFEEISRALPAASHGLRRPRGRHSRRQTPVSAESEHRQVSFECGAEG
mmetsp:Transcript_132413/g.423795  ORF Transcript_132413/g.423795 Transcript_132413/m.423795 type:complete len:277 (-) Transcript_132413:134-964(-)|eukprot:CAMPEP_0203865170 /NCGR_PEP_ID=MMETSP0359-20131031/15199_1 /ASSEMBLY_ACC=CAM_ASM_000338 /TAXON_ID=268821 /ORGANISM="Scrippsiella Hangoei, Strain SHTV-5" /LENGTH=276 /DNA_ID=CAMNT_0050783047 /DNA_START=107 /DNA_END=937 /DNA_ORIENTATION=+